MLLTFFSPMCAALQEFHFGFQILRLSELLQSTYTVRSFMTHMPIKVGSARNWAADIDMCLVLYAFLRNLFHLLHINHGVVIILQASHLLIIFTLQKYLLVLSTRFTNDLYTNKILYLFPILNHCNHCYLYNSHDLRE